MLKKNDFTALEGFLFIALAISSLIMILNLTISIEIIWAILFGLMFGSFSTSFVSRMPKGIIQKKAAPYCMSCNHALERRDLYTIFSYIINKGKCRFCSSAIPKIIFCTESMVTIAYIIAYIQYGFSIDYVIISFCYFFTIIATSLWINNRFIAYNLIGIVILLLMYYEYDHTLEQRHPLNPVAIKYSSDDSGLLDLGLKCFAFENFCFINASSEFSVPPLKILAIKQPPGFSIS